MSVTDSTEAAPTPPSRVLVCDDSEVERNALAHFLRRHGFAVDEVGDGAAAVTHLKTRAVDLLLLDLHMPQPDGFQVLSYVQEHRRALPVILLSGMPPDQIQHKMHSLRSPELPPLFIKPVDPNQLLQVVELQLSGQLPGVEARDQPFTE
jgi:DNA-binding response OmpR family regulator